MFRSVLAGLLSLALTSAALGQGLGSGIWSSSVPGAATGANSDITSLSGLTTPLSGAQGGTGVANTGKTITIGGNFTTSGAFATTLTATGATTITLPTSGTLAILGANVFTGEQTFSGSTIAGINLNLLTTTQKNALTPVNGMMVYDTTLSRTQFYSSGAWRSHVRLEGDAMAGALITLASTTATAGLNLPHGAAPTSPIDGDVWTTTAGLFGRINGTSQQYAPLVSPSFTTPTLGVAAGTSLNLSSSGGLSWNADTYLYRDAANTLAQRNSTSAQTFNIYNTHTDASNYERGGLSWSGNVLTVGAQAAGTGTSRIVRVGVGATVMDFDPATGAISAYRNGSSANTLMQLTSTGMTGAAITLMRLAPSINQGTTNAYTILDINPTETATGSGAKLLINGRIGAGASVFSVSNAGAVAAGALTQAVAKTFTITSGTNQRAGNLTLVGGTVTVSNTTVTTNTIVILTRKTSGGTVGTSITYTLSAGTSFTVTSDNVLDTSTFSYFLMEVV